MMHDHCCRDDRQEVTSGFDAAIDHAVASDPKSRQEFAWLVISYLVGWLDQGKIIPDRTVVRYYALTDCYGQISIGREVK